MFAETETEADDFLASLVNIFYRFRSFLLVTERKSTTYHAQISMVLSSDPAQWSALSNQNKSKLLTGKQEKILLETLQVI